MGPGIIAYVIASKDIPAFTLIDMSYVYGMYAPTQLHDALTTMMKTERARLIEVASQSPHHEHRAYARKKLPALEKSLEALQRLDPSRGVGVKMQKEKGGSGRVSFGDVTIKH